MITIHKKSTIFQPILVIGTFIVLTFALFNFNSHIDELTQSKSIGSSQINIIKTYQKAENILFYIDQSAKLSMKQSIYDLGVGGGFYDNSSCGYHLIYFLWQKGEETCFPDFRNNFKSLLNDNLNKYLEAYPGKPNLDFLKNSYDFTLFENKLIGNALEPIEIDIIEEINSEEKLVGKYSIKPSFSIKEDLNINQYSTLIENVKKINEVCNAKPVTELKKCIKEEQPNWVDKDEISDTLFLFEIPTDKKVWVYDGSKLVLEEVIIKFGIDFS